MYASSETVVKLLIIDTLSAYMGGVDTHRDADVRRVLSPLADLARETNVTILGLRHLNKDESGRAIYRGQASIGFTAQARAVWMVVRDPDDDEHRLLLPIKNNLVPEEQKTALGFALDSFSPQRAPTVFWDDEPIRLTQAEIESYVRGKVPGPTQIERAEDLLEAALADGKEVQVPHLKELAEQKNISWWAMEKAKKNLHLQHRTDGFQGPTAWSLPQSRDEKGQDGPEIEDQATQSRGLLRVRLSRGWHEDPERRKAYLQREYDLEPKGDYPHLRKRLRERLRPDA